MREAFKKLSLFNLHNYTVSFIFLMHLAFYVPVACDFAVCESHNSLQPIFENLNHIAALAVCLSTSLLHQRTVAHKTN